VNLCAQAFSGTHTLNDQQLFPFLALQTRPRPFGAHMLTIRANLSPLKHFYKKEMTVWKGVILETGPSPAGSKSDRLDGMDQTHLRLIYGRWENYFH